MAGEGNIKREDFERLVAFAREHGEPPGRIYVHESVIARWQEIERKGRHWYWRLWWRVRFAPVDLRDWLRERLTDDEDEERDE